MARLIPALIGLAAALSGALPAYAQPLPNGLPTHFAFGIEAAHGDTWLQQSGTPWDYRWQYLAGGVNTAHGWETWNEHGTFALNYANESDQHGYIPMFPYYEIFQSNGDCDRWPAAQDGAGGHPSAARDAEREQGRCRLSSAQTRSGPPRGGSR